MKYFLLAGEASGDLHGSNLVKELKHIDPDGTFFGWGGNEMEKAGVKLLKHISELSFMGFVEVLLNIRTIKRNFKACHQQLLDIKPDVLILIDFPGFNLRVAEFAYKHGIRVHYYISPTVWAWHKSRVYTVRDYTHKMFAILPFEKAFYAKYNVDVEYEGHPLLDALDFYRQSPSVNVTSNKPYIAILPGSRKQEISAMLPIMLKAAKELGDNYDYILAAAPSIEREYLESFIDNDNIRIVYGNTYGVLSGAVAGMITSGTATLETALFGVPQVVCYKTSPISFYIAKRLVSVKYISLVNLILDKLVVTELIQNELKVDVLVREMQQIMPGGEKNQMLKDEYKILADMLGGAGTSRRIAQKIYQDICPES